MQLSDFRVLSFDCYGTLIDWETGIWNALQPMLENTGRTITREQALADFAEIEPKVEHDHPDLLYRDLLGRVHAALAVHWQLPAGQAQDNAFGRSIPDWPVFPDTTAALAYLKQHFRLVILSNVDRQSFAATNVKLGVTFDAICTAEDIGTYKPDHRNFQYLLSKVESLGHRKAELLHVAQSPFHDLAPAEQLGISRCWINRRAGQANTGGATKVVKAMPKLDFQFQSLGAFADAHRSCH